MHQIQKSNFLAGIWLQCSTGLSSLLLKTDAAYLKLWSKFKKREKVAAFFMYLETHYFAADILHSLFNVLIEHNETFTLSNLLKK